MAPPSVEHPVKSVLPPVLLLSAAALAGAIGWVALRPGTGPADGVRPTGDGGDTAREAGTDVIGTVTTGGGTSRNKGGRPDGKTNGGKAAPVADPDFIDGPRRTTDRAEVIRAGEDPRAGRSVDDDPDAVAPREPGPLPEGGIGPDRSRKWSKEDAVRVEAMEIKAGEAFLPEIKWNNRSLKAAAEELGRLAGMIIELGSEDLADEPVTLSGKDLPALDVLMRIAETRHLRFEFQPDKVVIKR